MRHSAADNIIEGEGESTPEFDRASALRWGVSVLLCAPVVLPLWFALIFHSFTFAAAAWSGMLNSLGF